MKKIIVLLIVVSCIFGGYYYSKNKKDFFLNLSNKFSGEKATQNSSPVLSVKPNETAKTSIDSPVTQIGDSLQPKAAQGDPSQHHTTVVNPSMLTTSVSSTSKLWESPPNETATDVIKKKAITVNNPDPNFVPVYFPYNSSALTAQAKKMLHKYANILLRNKKFILKAEGNWVHRHDSVENSKLAYARAKSVRDFLGELSVPWRRVELSVKDKKQRTARKTHQNNRRVDLLISKT